MVATPATEWVVLPLLCAGSTFNASSFHARMQAPARVLALTTQGTLMNVMITSPSAKHERSGSAGNEILSDYRERRALEALERAELKRVNLAEQHASLNSADLRIRAWERVHQLRMPSDPLHPALDAIAAATQLTLADVRNEQRLRSARRTSGGI